MSGSCTAWDPLLNRRLHRPALRLCDPGQPLPVVLGGGGEEVGRVSVLLTPRKGSPRLHSPASVARWASTSPSIKKSQWDFSDRQLQQWLCWLHSPVTWQLWQTDKRHTHTHTQRSCDFSCLSGFNCAAGLSGTTEGGSLIKAFRASIRPLIFTLALPLSACEVAILVKKEKQQQKKLLVYYRSKQHWRCGFVVWIGRCPITDRPGACCEGGRLSLPSEAPPLKNTPLLFFFFFAVVVCLAL